MCSVGINVHCQNKLGNKIQKFQELTFEEIPSDQVHHLHIIFLHVLTIQEILVLPSLIFIITLKISSNKLSLGDYKEFHLLKYNAAQLRESQLKHYLSLDCTVTYPRRKTSLSSNMSHGS